MKATKAKTRSARRRGRKKVLNVPREPNGRISRSGIHHDAADEVAIQARVRRTGLPKAAARDQKAGSFVGYLNILGRGDGLSDDQYEGATKFLDLRNDYLKAIKAPNGMLSSGNLGSATAEITDEYVRWCSRVREQYAECRRALQEAQFENRTVNVWAAIDYCIIRDEWHSHMLPSLRVACNALARFFKG